MWLYSRRADRRSATAASSQPVRQGAEIAGTPDRHIRLFLMNVSGSSQTEWFTGNLEPLLSWWRKMIFMAKCLFLARRVLTKTSTERTRYTTERKVINVTKYSDIIYVTFGIFSLDFTDPFTVHNLHLNCLSYSNHQHVITSSMIDIDLISEWI